MAAPEPDFNNSNLKVILKKERFERHLASVADTDGHTSCSGPDKQVEVMENLIFVVLFSPFAAVESEKRQSIAEKALKTNMFKIIELINKVRDHVPDVNLNAKDAIVFPYEVRLLFLVVIAGGREICVQ